LLDLRTVFQEQEQNLVEVLRNIGRQKE
jgi:hypothetical protein